MSLTEQLMNCNDAREVDRIVENNIMRLDPTDRQRLTIMANKSKKRIITVQREKKLSWKPNLN